MLVIKICNAMIRDESILEQLNLIKYHMHIFPDLSDLSNPYNEGAYWFWAVIFPVIFLVVILVFRKAIYKLLKRCLCKKKKLPEQRFLNIVLTASIPSQATGQDPQTIRPRTYSNIGRLDDVSEPQYDGKLTRFFKSTASLVTKPFLGSGRRSKEETRELVEAIQNLRPPGSPPIYKGPPEKLVKLQRKSEENVIILQLYWWS